MQHSSDILLELTFYVRSDMSKAHLLHKTSSFYVKKLNCQAGIIIPENWSKENHSITVLFPKAFENDKSYTAIFEHLSLHLEKRTKNDLTPFMFKENKYVIYAFKLSSYGYFIAIKLNEFPIVFVNNLIPVFQFYGDTLNNIHKQEYRQEIEQLLLKERKLFKTILDNIPVRINLKDLELKRVISNKAELIFLDKTTDKEILGKTDENIETEEKLVLETQKALYNKEVKDSLGRYFLVSKIPYKGELETTEGIISLAIDITANKQKEKDLSFFKEVINQSLDAIIITFENGKLYYCNSITREWLGLEEDSYTELMYQEFDVEFSKQTSNQWKQHIKELNNIKSKTITSTFINNTTQKIIPVEIKQKYLVHNNVALIVSICRDISEKIESEKTIKEELKFQDLLLKISSTYINTELINIETTIQQSLKEIGLFVKADRSYIFDYDNQLKTASNTFEWCAPGITEEMEHLQNVPTYNIQDWLNQHQKGLPFLIENVDELPYEGEYCIKEILASQNIKSLITIPLMDDQKLIGFIGFDSVKDLKIYSDKEKKLLSLYAGLLVNIKKRSQDAYEIRSQGERFKSIIQSVDLGLIEVNQDFEVLFVNENLSKLYEYRIEEVLGKNALDFFLKEEVKKSLYEDLLHLKSDDTLNLELATLTKSQKEKIIFISIGLRTDEHHQPVGYTGALLDISEQKQLEEDLKLAKEKAEKSSIEKDKFLANMSHEMRTPLNIINGILAELYLLNKDSKEQSFLLKQTKNASDHLLNLVNNVLDMAKINAGEMVLTQSVFNLRKVCDDSFSILAPLAKEKNLEYRISFDSKITYSLKGDALKLSQVLVNLLNNAIKFTNQGYVSLKVELVNEGENFCAIKFSITDTGIGMSKHFLKNLYTEFSTEKTTAGSTGLGMTIAKKIIDLMEGEIDITSKKKIGTTVDFTIDFKKSEKQKKDSSSSTERNDYLSGKKILVVEDNMMNALIVRRQLERKGAIVTSLENGSEAIQYLKENLEDLILMDIQMPIMGGIECTQYIRKKLKLSTPIIALTANVFKDDLENYLKNGFNDYLTKPYKENMLIEKCINNLGCKDTPKLEKKVENLSTEISLKRIYEIANHDEAFVNELIETFEMVISTAYKELKILIEEKDLEKTKRLFHKVKPSIYDFGLGEFSSCLNEVMSANSYKSIHNKVVVFHYSLLLLLRQIKKIK